MARTVFEPVGRRLGQTVLTENRGGAGTTTGMAMVAKSAPDGYTILVNSTSYAVVASTYAKLPYDPVNDMTGVALLAHLPFVVAASVKYKTLAELVAAGQIKPTPLNYGSIGPGSSGYLFAERLLHAAHFEARHVSFRGTPEAITEVIAGRIDVYPGAVPNFDELAKDRQINVLAVGSTRRSSLFPDIPTTLEAGYPGSDYNFWMGSYVPAQTPPAIVKRLNAEVLEVLKSNDVIDKIKLLGGEVQPMGLAEFNAFIARERETNAGIVKLIDYKPQ
jgi:tripartite-type tricarboxylate transporter receptor subunit TctC